MGGKGAGSCRGEAAGEEGGTSWDKQFSQSQDKFKVCSVYCVLLTVYCALCTVKCVLCIGCCRVFLFSTVLITVHGLRCSLYCVLCTVYF